MRRGVKMKRLIVFLSALLSTSAYAENFTATDKVLFFSTDVLIEVIERNFDKNLQLDVANKYIELMDSTTHSVSIADLTTVCATGQIDSAKCRNFINDLFTTMGIGDTVKPFYWADYVSANPEPIRLAVFASGDGYHKHDGLAPGQWAITFGWMNKSSFRMQYPKIQSILGTSACTSEYGTKYTADSSKNFEPNEISGDHCWCKMAGPEESEWVYTIEKSGGRDGNCERSCALECISALRQEQDMRAAMFTAVKLNGSNEHGTIDPKKIKDEFKPCEFDWGNDPRMSAKIGRSGWRPEEKDIWVGGIWKWRSGEETVQLADGLNYGEGAIGGLNFMKSEGFKCKYPHVNKIKFVATLNDQPGEKWQLTNKSFKANERTGTHCWCRIISPEKSKWFNMDDASVTEWDTLTDLNSRFDACIHTCVFYMIWDNNENGWYEAFGSIGKK